MPITLMTLNMEGKRHLERVRSLLSAHQPDVVCLQEAPELECMPLAAELGYRVFFAPSVLETRANDSCWGVAMFTRLPLRTLTTSYYSQEPAIRTLALPNDPRRVLLVADFEHSGATYRVMTTHFTWSALGRASPEQLEDFERMKSELRRYPHYVLCGDFNAPRGGAIYAKFTDELQLTDNLPSSIATTIDGSLHRAGHLGIVVDTIFSTSAYEVSDVRVLSGVSDHMAVLGVIRPVDQNESASP